MRSWIRRQAAWALYPGLDLYTRSRYRLLPKFFRPGPIDTLDAGCGNGALSYAAYKLGNRVLGITNDPDQIHSNRARFAARGLDAARLNFELCNLYDLAQLNRRFDQIICSETLEHIKRDEVVIRQFHDALRPGGVLHLCCPFALHPDHNQGRVDAPEDGGHVRDGYTFESYRTLLEPAGFRIVHSMGLGSPFLLGLDKVVRLIRNTAGDAAALPVFLLTWPLQFLDQPNPKVPYSMYVQAAC
jgi:cyclopropane fatty-acyl-phospholipid synthase-like methyltransferase